MWAWLAHRLPAAAATAGAWAGARTRQPTLHLPRRHAVAPARLASAHPTSCSSFHLPQILYEARDWKQLQEYVVLLSKRRSQLKQAVQVRGACSCVREQPWGGLVRTLPGWQVKQALAVQGECKQQVCRRDGPQLTTADGS